jgi:hypothetical protein
MTMRTLGFCLLLGVIGLALTWLSGQVGWWWVTSIVGVLIGLLLRPAWLALVTSLAVGGLGWGLPLALLAFTAPVGRTAAAVEALVDASSGLPATGGTIFILLTVVVGCMLSLVGTWVGIAARRLPVFA